MEHRALVSKQAIEKEELNFKGSGRLYPLAPDVLKVGARIDIENVEDGLFGVAVMDLKRGKIVSVIERGKNVIVKARFVKKKKFTKEETINYLLGVAEFKSEKLRESFKKALSLNFAMEDLEKILRSDKVRFETPKEIIPYEDGLFLRVGNVCYKM